MRLSTKLISGGIWTLVHSVERWRVFLIALVIVPLLVTFGPSREAASQIATAMPTPASPATIAPLLKNSGEVDNGLLGSTSILCAAGTGLAQNELVILAINTLSGDTTITPPPTGPGSPPWNLISFPSPVNGDYTQQLYWHQVGSAENGSPLFVFTFSNGQGPEIVKAACAAGTFKNTCLESQFGCPNGSPIFDLSVGTSTQGDQVTQSGTSMGGEPFGQINVPSAGLVFAVFGTSDTNSKFGDTANYNANTNGGFYTPETGTFTEGLSSVNGVSGHNGGLAMATKRFSSSVDGPFPASLPQRSDPMGGVQITSVNGDGTTAKGTVAEPGVLNQSMPFQAYVESVDPVCFNTPSGNGATVTVTPTLPLPSTTFTYASSCIGVGQMSTGLLFVQDPGMGDNVSQVISIAPETP
jgi:hypothetical protein